MSQNIDQVIGADPTKIWKEKRKPTITWAEAALKQPFIPIDELAKPSFTFQKINERRNSGFLLYPVVVFSSSRNPLYIISDHHHIIDVLQHAGIHGPIGSIQLDQHLDLAATEDYLPSARFEAAFNAELIRRGIFYSNQMVIGLPYKDAQPSMDDLELVRRITTVRLLEKNNPEDLMHHIEMPYIYHLDLDFLCGKTEYNYPYSLPYCTPPNLINNATATILITSPMSHGYYNEKELADINNLIHHW